MEHSVLEISVFVSFGLLLLAFAFAFYRLFRGPSSSDRIVALDLIASIVMGFILRIPCSLTVKSISTWP